MTDEQINIAIAEACGWWGNIKLIDGIPFGRPPKITSEYIELPDYCGDLNAMHEAEKTLSEEQWENYNFILCNLVGGYSKTNKEAIHASSRQKAEAFLETIKK